MEKDIQKQEENWLEKVIKTLLIVNYYKKFITLNQHKIYLENLYGYLKKDIGATWIKKAPFISKAKKIYNTFNSKYHYYKKNSRLKKIQRKYPNLQITEAFFYLAIKGKCKLKDEDLEAFEEMLEIIFAKIKQKKK